MLKYLRSLFNKKERITKKYLNAAYSFGDAISYLPIAGKCHNFNSLFKKYKKYEKLYQSLGFETIPLDYFINGEDIYTMVGVSKKTDNLYAEIYEKEFLHMNGNDFLYDVKQENGFVTAKAFLPSVLEVMDNKDTCKEVIRK